jgi:hypothetical protein
MEIGQPTKIREVEPLEVPVPEVIRDPQPAPAEVPFATLEQARARFPGHHLHQPC